ncbi:MAG: hypothetical protein WDZ35_11745 [Crocinitomicaceae bacterium]
MKKIFYIVVAGLLFSGCGSGENEDGMNGDGSADEVDGQQEEQQDSPEIDISLTKIRDIPRDCEFEGEVVDAYTWTDENGLNYFMRTMGKPTEGEKEISEDLPSRSQYLYAYHYVEDEKGGIKLLCQITDFVKDCQFDLIIGHELDAISLTDLDENGLGEVSFIYRLNCTSDVSPATQKLILIENGDKYVLRGHTSFMEHEGEYTVGEEFKNAPDGFQEHAEKLWSKHLTEYDFEL